MKVGFVTQFPTDPESPQGGVEAVSVVLAEALAAFPDLEVHVVTLDSTIINVQVSRLENGLIIHRIPVSKGSILLNSFGPWRKKLWKYLLDLQPHVVHAHDTYGIMVKCLNIPRVLTIHGFIYRDTLVSGKNFFQLKSFIWRLVETSAWADHPHIISISPYVRERLTGIARGVIHDIDNPVSVDYFNIHRNEKKGVIFCAAVISPRKNTLSLIQAFSLVVKEFPDAQLRLAGAIVDAEYGRQVKEAIREMGLEGKALLLGRINRGEICKELSHTSIFTLVSLEENSPMGIEEAMAVGIPIVTSNRCGMPYMVRHGESGFLVDPLRPKEIANRLCELLDDDSLRHAMGVVGLDIAKNRYHPVAVAEKTRRVYLEALSKD